MCTTVCSEHKLCYNNYDFIESMNLKSDWPHTAMTSFMDDPLSHLNKFRIFLILVFYLQNLLYLQIYKFHRIVSILKSY